MLSIGFSHSKLVLRMILCTLGLLLMIFVSLTAQAPVVPLVLAGFLAAFAANSAFTLMSGRPALELDERGITVNNLLTSRTVAWADVAEVKVQTITLYYLGFIPASRHAHLIIKTTASWVSGNRVTTSTSAMQLPPGGHAELLELIEAARQGALGGGVQRRAPAPEVEQGGSGFDPDAAIARYLARRSEEVGAPALPPRPTFGRKGA